MASVRETGNHKDYIINKLEEYAKLKSKFVYCGHFHEEINGTNFKALASTGYNLKYYLIDEFLVIPDLHYNLAETNDGFKQFDFAVNGKYKRVIFLGDTFDLILLDEKDILNDKRFWLTMDYLNAMEIPVFFVVGNHDINLCKGEIHKKLLTYKNVSIVDELESDKYIFIHGQIFDPNVYPYMIIFKYADYIGGKYVRWAWNKIRKWFYGKKRKQIKKSNKKNN